jgi:hypothetical protein
MPTYTTHSLKEAMELVDKHNRARQRRVEAAIKATARDGADIVRKAVPAAFGELGDSVHAEGARIVADAPHAGPVETGSRPHRPPLGPLVAWVKLRGMQALDRRGKVNPRKNLPGSTTFGHAARVGKALADLAQARGIQLMSDAIAVARAIQEAIARHGTRPHWFMRSSLPKVLERLDVRIHSALEDR